MGGSGDFLYQCRFLPPRAAVDCLSQENSPETEAYGSFHAVFRELKLLNISSIELEKDDLEITNNKLSTAFIFKISIGYLICRKNIRRSCIW